MSTLRHFYPRAVAGLLMSLGSAVVVAATSTTTFDVTATVADACQVSATNLAFGDINSIAGVDANATSTVTVTCSLGTTYAIALDAGLNESTSGDVTTRRMKNTADATKFLSYQLYSVAGTTVWGDTAGTNDVTGLGTGLGVAATVFGTVPTGQEDTAPAGSYSDTVSVTVTY